MAQYNEEKLTKLKALKQLAERINQDYATKTELTTKAEELSGRIDDIVSTGGEPNVLVGVKVNGSDLPITEKKVDVKVPTKVGELTNDKKFQTDTEVETTIDSKIKAWAELVTADNETIDTFKELVNWVAEHGTEAGELANSIEALEALVGKETVSKQITDALETALKSEGADKYALASALTEAVSSLTSKIEAKADTGHDHEDATKTKHGFMSVNDKTKLDSIDFATDQEVTAMLDDVFVA